MTIPNISTVVAGAPITAAHHSDVATAVNRLAASQEVVEYNPGVNIDATTTGPTLWVTLGNVTVPTWATEAQLAVYLNAIYDITVANNQYNLLVKLGGVGNKLVRVVGLGISQRFSASWATKILTPPTGSQALIIEATRVSGTGQFRADSLSDFDARITFR